MGLRGVAKHYAPQQLTSEGVMATKKGATRTVSFFRVVVHDDSGTPVQFPHQDWQTLLGKVNALPLLERTYQGPTRKLIGEVLSVDGDYALKLMEPRDENSWLEILQGAQGAQPVDAKKIGELVETTIVTFLFEKNLFGVIRGSTSSPSHAAVGEWLNNLQIGGQRLVQDAKHIVTAEPALSQIQQKQLSTSDGVGTASMRVSTSQATALQNAGATIVGDTLKKLKNTYGDIIVTVTLRIPQGKANDAARKALKAETQIWESSGAKPEAISATLVNYDGQSKAHQQEVNFIAERITMQRGVPLTDNAGNPIRNDSAVRAILGAAQDMAQELKSVV
jgi:hypothetical protein